VQFGKVFADHMFVAEYTDGKWQNLSIQPYGDISLSPALSALHYGQSIFEGMKAYKNLDGEALLFRPLDNIKRLNFSAARMCMPEIPENIFMEGLKKLVDIDRDWIPTKDGSSLYIRPFMFATDDFVGVRPSNNFLFIIFSCPVNAYYTQPLKVIAEDRYVRAVKGGVGETKCAGNYGLSMLPTREAQEKGYHQIIWLDGIERKYVEETGTTNVFFVIGDKLITPALNGSILAGVTRDSIIQLAKSWGKTVEERPISIDEVIEAQKKGQLLEAFGSGTAATIAQVVTINYKGVDYNLPPVEERKVAPALLKQLEEIRTGKVPDTFGWMHKV
jgi:branched-chain amino acid aminotransferase